MANQDDFIKTALRLPRALHAAIRDAAQEGGKSMNAEIIGRLQDSLRAEEVGSLLDQLRSRETELLEAKGKQLDLMVGLIARADITLGQSSDILAACPSDERTSRLRHEIAILRDLINAIQVSKA